MPVLLDINAPERAVSGISAELLPVTQSLADRLADVQVTDLASCNQAVLDRQLLGDTIKRVTAFFAPYKAMADKLHKTLCTGERDINAPLLALDTALRDAITQFHVAEQRARQAREQALADEQRRDREQRAAAEAAALLEQGDVELANAVVHEALTAPAPIVVLPNAMAHVHFRRSWKWKYEGGPADVKRTPPDVLARALAKIPREFLCVDDTKIGGYVRSMKASGSIAGIDIYAVDEPVR